MVKRNSVGSSLIEAMIAMLILAIMGTAIITFTIQIMSLNTSARLKNQGTITAEQSIERARNVFQQQKFSYFKNNHTAGNYSSGDLTFQISNCSPLDCQNNPPGDPYFSCVILSYPSSDQARVQSVVYWWDKGVCRGTEVDTYFTNY